MKNFGSKRPISKVMTAAALLSAICMLFFAACSPSNGSEYDCAGIKAEQTALTGKTVYWLGSSVTYGMESDGVAVADYIAARNGAVCVKEAVSGTTLIDEPYKKLFSSYDSYVTRLKDGDNFDKTADIDAFVCQISTNDAKSAFENKRGKIEAADVVDKTEFDVKTTLGAIEYIIAYVHETWDCPIYFYSGSEFTDSGVRKNKDPSPENYASIVEKTHEIAKKWTALGVSVKVIDLFNDKEFNAITDEQFEKYMHDPVHPYKAGYLEWWTPYFEKVLTADLSA